LISTKKLHAAVKNKKVLIDSNVIIYLTEDVHPYNETAQLLFTMVEEGAAEAVISILSVAEVMTGPLRKGYSQIALEVRNYLLNFPNVYCQEVTLDVLEVVGNEERIEWTGLRATDSLIIASGLINDVDLFISNDIHFIKSIPEEMIIYLNS